VGPREWDKIVGRFKDVAGRATIFRYIKEVKDEVEKSAAASSSGALRMAQKRIHASTDSPEKMKGKIKAHLPHPPSPAIVADDPVKMQTAFNFLAFFRGIIDDSEALRMHSLFRNPDGTAMLNEDGTVKIKNPNLLGQNILQRRNLADTYLNAYATVYDAQRIEELYNAIIEEIGTVSPDVQRAILVKMRELDNRRGLTMNAKLQ
jgi:hypothetical protein